MFLPTQSLKMETNFKINTTALRGDYYFCIKFPQLAESTYITSYASQRSQI